VAELTKSLNLHQLLQNDKYVIPLYQRNFSWEREEIHQLLKDINDTYDTNDFYYLGTLVVAKINGCEFVIIDGQQRHTTFSIINAVIKNKDCDKAVETRNLYFEAREKSERILDELIRDKNSYQKIKNFSTNDNGIKNIISAVQDVEDFMNENFKDPESESKFFDRFYSKVIIFRAELPSKTDLNHYFEVMNNRGEQLEKHEILKAAFLGELEKQGRKKEQSAFALIWDACSQMNAHIQMNFKPEYRKELFGEKLQSIPTKETIQRFIEKVNFKSNSDKNDDGEIEVNDIISIIKNYKLPEKFNQNKKEDSDEKFNSIIDFPNFLLQILKLQFPATSLDDKFLFVNFKYPKGLPDAMDFIVNLLKYRVCFDRYVVKREGEIDNLDWSWSLKKAVKTKDVYQTTFEKEDLRRELRMIQSMFHVTFPANNYKNWLFILMQFFKDKDPINITGEAILNNLKNQAIKYYKENKTDDIFNAGLRTPRFMFNYLDYLLWVEYYYKIRNNTELNDKEAKTFLNKILKNKEKFYSFKFVQRSSIEHLFPQARINEINAESENERQIVLDSFGNLCLISRNSNSSYNSDLPSQKKHDSRSKNESLKQLIMFESFEGENWNKNQIEAHCNEMKELLKINTENNETI